MRVVAGAVLVILLAGCLGGAPAELAAAGPGEGRAPCPRRPRAPAGAAAAVRRRVVRRLRRRATVGYWRAVADGLNAKFTFFVSGVYLRRLGAAHRYDPPGLPRGDSAIGFAQETGDWIAAIRCAASRRLSRRRRDRRRTTTATSARRRRQRRRVDGGRLEPGADAVRPLLFRGPPPGFGRGRDRRRAHAVPRREPRRCSIRCSHARVPLRREPPGAARRVAA